MRLEQIAIDLRPRTAWEATDLGFAMAQAWWKTIAGAWCAVYFPVTLLVNLLCWGSPYIAVFIMWWLKPAFDRVVLHVLAGATFGVRPTVRETLRALPRLWWNNGLFAALTYGRINFARSFDLPVTQLEKSFGKAARNRRSVLGREGRGTAVWLTVIGLHLEFLLVMSFYLMVNLFTPGEPVFQMSMQQIFNPQVSKEVQYFGNLVNALTITILEPFYVAAGFAIYLNSRTAIEGWDVELAFKRMSARIAHAADALKGTVSVAAAMLLAVSLLALAPAPAEAQSCPISPDAAEQVAPEADAPTDTEPTGKVRDYTPFTGAKNAIVTILENKDFGEKRTRITWNYTGPKWWEQEARKKHDWDGMARFLKFFAESVRVMTWIAGGILVLTLLYLIARYVSINGWGHAGGSSMPDVLFGLDVRPESLPDDIAQSARAMLDRGDIRNAVSLLYRAALVSLIQDGRIDIRRGDTEGECVAMVRRAYSRSDAEQAKHAYFAGLVALWQRVAYAGETIGRGEIEPLAAGWPDHFRIVRAETRSTAGASAEGAAA
jgi:hypothetical protein